MLSIFSILTTTEEERNNLARIENIDNILLNIRNSLRKGEVIGDGVVDKYMNDWFWSYLE